MDTEILQQRISPAQLFMPRAAQVPQGAPQMAVSTTAASALKGSASVSESLAGLVGNIFKEYREGKTLGQRDKEGDAAHKLKMDAIANPSPEAKMQISLPADGGISASPTDPSDALLSSLRVEEARGRIADRKPQDNALLSDIETSATDMLGFIKGFEGFKPKAYADGAQTSVGWGTRAKSADEELTREQADERLNEELAMHAKRVDDAIASTGAQLLPHQRDALISYDYNTGLGASAITKYAKSGNQAIADAIRMGPRTSQGKYLPGLERRRNAEADLFLSGYGTGRPKSRVVAETATEVIQDIPGIGTVAVPRKITPGEPSFRTVIKEPQARQSESTGMKFSSAADASKYLSDNGMTGKLRPTPDGTVELTDMSPYDAVGKTHRMTESEAKVDTYHTRAKQASEDIKKVKFDATGIAGMIAGAAQESDTVNYLANKAGAISPEAQEFTRSATEFVNAINRRDSGATITKEEWKNALNRYFPRPGDSPEVIAQKEGARATALQALGASLPDYAPSKQPTQPTQASNPATQAKLKELLRQYSAGEIEDYKERARALIILRKTGLIK